MKKKTNKRPLIINHVAYLLQRFINVKFDNCVIFRQNSSIIDNCMFRPIRGSGTMNVPTPMDLGYDRSWTNQNLSGRRSLTPQELMNIGANTQYKVSNGSVNFSDDGKVIRNYHLLIINLCLFKVQITVHIIDL